MKTTRLFAALCVLLFSVGCATTAPAHSPDPAPPTPADAGTVAAAPAPVEDPWLWLEDVTADKSLDWARQRNQTSTAELAKAPGFDALKTRILGILNSKDRLPAISKQGSALYNFWRDEAHPRGLWRRVPSLAEFKKPAPKWETVLDLDALATSDKENWVWHGASCLAPKDERCLVKLSRGGADADVVREFDTVKKDFVQGGFSLPEAKSFVDWQDLDTLFVATDFGPGTLTDSGYPRQVKTWKRGTPLSDAKLLHQVEQTDVLVSTFNILTRNGKLDFVNRAKTFFEAEYFWVDHGALVKIEVPMSAVIGAWDDQLLVTLRDDWTIGGTTWPKGSLLTTPFKAFLKGERSFTSLYTPAPNSALTGFTPLKSGLLTNSLVDVHNVLTSWTRKGGKWVSTPIELGPKLGSVTADELDHGETSDDVLVVTTDFTTPSTLSFAKLGKKPEVLKQSPAFFDAKDLVVEQHFATSRDGTKVPYFQVSRSNLVLDGHTPTLLTGYGGFEVSLEAAYSATAGAAWLEKGGVFVQANIRGGGEYGPAWHQAALKTKRQAAYDDFAAIAEDLIARKVTSPQKLGIQGGSNGGLLMGVMLTQRPELFGAIVCQVPLLDMKRYSQLLAGASWMSEYGDPNVTEEWAAISKYSPYQNVKKDAHYPRTLFTTSTRDDRVHPGHARKMVARMLEQGHDVLYYENTEGGHAGSANNEQRAFMTALSWTFLARQLGL